MAAKRLGGDGHTQRPAREAIVILQRALERGLGHNLADEAAVYGLLADAHELVNETENANRCLALQRAILEKWIASGIFVTGNQLSRVCSQTAELCELTGRPLDATKYRAMANDARTGYSLFYEARQRVQNARVMTAEVASEVIPMIERAVASGFDSNLQDELNAWALLATAFEAVPDEQRAAACRGRELTTLEEWIGQGIPTESDRLANAYGQAADLYEKRGQLEKAAAFRQLREDSRDGLLLLSETLAELRDCGKEIGKELGSRLLDKLTKAAQRIPETLTDRHAEINRATAQILDAWGDVAQAIELIRNQFQKGPSEAREYAIYNCCLGNSIVPLICWNRV
jgi:hypothetical protein